VDDVRGKPGRIRRLRETLADALHGRSELPGNVSSAAGSSAAIERQVNAANKSAAGAQISPALHCGSLGVARRRVAPPPRMRCGTRRATAGAPSALPWPPLRRLVFGVRLILAGLHHRGLQSLALLCRDLVIASALIIATS